PRPGGGPRASAALSSPFSQWARGRFARSTRFDSGRLPKTAQLAFSLLRAARETVAGKVERILQRRRSIITLSLGERAGVRASQPSLKTLTGKSPIANRQSQITVGSSRASWRALPITAIALASAPSRERVILTNATR